MSCDAGLVIPAHPLALTAERRLRRAPPAGPLALLPGRRGGRPGRRRAHHPVRHPRARASGCYRPVLELAAEAARARARPGGVAADRPIVLVAGVVRSHRAGGARGASLAGDLGYHAVLLQPGGAVGDATDDELDRALPGVSRRSCRCSASTCSRPSVGGVLAYDFWRRFASIANVVAIKIAPFNRYQTLDVVRAVAELGSGREIALYTGNDDNIVADLLTRLETLDAAASPWRCASSAGCWGTGRSGRAGRSRCWGGCSSPVRPAGPCPRSCSSWHGVRRMRTLRSSIQGTGSPVASRASTRCCVARVCLTGLWTLAEDEGLSPGQLAEIDRVCAAYPELTDDGFVAAHLDEWLA